MSRLAGIRNKLLVSSPPGRTDAFCRIETLLSPAFATTASGRPLPSRSATAMDTGVSPAAVVYGPAKVPDPVPCRTETVPLDLLAVTRSILPSPFRSPTAIATGSAQVA